MESASTPDAAIGRNIFQCLASWCHGCQEKKKWERERGERASKELAIQFQ